MLQDCVGAWQPTGDLATMDAESLAKSEENWVQVVGKAKAGSQPMAVKKGSLFDKRNKSGAKEKDKADADEYTSEEERQADQAVGARPAPAQD